MPGGWNSRDCRDFECQEQPGSSDAATVGSRGGLGGLGCPAGAKPKRKEEDMAHLEQCLDTDQRTYNSAQLAGAGTTSRKPSADRIRRILQKGSAGSTRHSQQRQ